MPQVLNTIVIEDPKLRHWSKSEYHEMAELGWFRGQRAELIDGEIVVLSPQKFEHGRVADRATEKMRELFGASFWVRMQLPLDLGPNSEPEPDVSVVTGRREDYHDHPKQAVLVIEVSDTTLSFDRGEKAGLYARAGVQDYWILDLVHRQLHIHRDPIPDPTQANWFTYGSIETFQGSDVVAPLNLPAGRVRVSELLGDRVN